MIISKDEEEEGRTVFDGEGHTTFIKREKFGAAAFSLKEGVEGFHMQNFHWVRLRGRPLKDCWSLLRWYFSKG